ncbi:unnamed protein product [Cyberlindnera jadinii]|uniref:Uncharacterized protein n=1 Tax=Cyberlindnera jadinii (strain ATCC 18201 / CBS 1600 / BCRC 20928 / JCM 3617 / NBRC 0987 / NRRL Y-1542) TaxID=983966 RepID=A0A0H5CHB5_CYBJN|nr:unnamed protein product [Cyberlindnera jadinii]
MTFTVPAQDADATTKVGAVDDAFLYQFGEVDKAIANFTKHQPFNHHYAPNVHMNRGRNNHHHNNGGRQNSGNGYNHSNNNNNNSSNSNNVNNNNGMFQSPANFAMTAQLKQQQHQQFLNQGLQNINRLKSSNGLLSGGPNQQMKTHQLQQQQQQQQVYMPQQQAPQQQQQYYDNRSAYNGNSLQASNFYSGNPLVNKFSAFQNQSAISTGDMLSPLRASPPAFPTGFANESPHLGLLNSVHHSTIRLSQLLLWG